MSVNKQYCTFFLNGHFFGIEVMKIQEVIRYQEMTRVPLASRAIQGLINLRGQIVTAIDLRHRLGMPERSKDQKPTNVVVRTEEGAVSLLVDEIGDVIEVDSVGYERPPETLAEASRELIRGVYKLKDRLLLVLETEKALNLEAGQN